MRRRLVISLLLICGVVATPAAHAAPPRLIYIGDWSGSSEVYSLDPLRPASLAQLTFGHEPSCDPLDDYCGVLGVLPSPDGRQIAFVSGMYCRTGYLYVARADGRAPHRIAPMSGCPTGGFDWAPDSGRLAYAANGSVYVVRRDGSHRRLVAAGGDPVWSPDGRALAYQVNGYLSVLRNGRRQGIASGAVDDYAWSPNGKWLAIGTHTNSPYSAHLEIIRRDGTGERKLTDSYALSLSWSRDGRFIAYSNSGLNVVDLATGAVRTVGPEHGYRHPWSPRGHLLAFDGEHGLSLFDADTGTTRPLGSDHAESISWSPDGRSLAYFLDRNLWPFNGDDIRVASLSGDVIAVLPAWQTAGGSMGALAWTRTAGTTRYRPPEPRNAATVSATEVVAPWKVERIATDGGRVLYTTCGHVFVWTPRAGTVAQAEPAASLSPRCTTPHNYRAFEVYNIALAGNRIAFGARNGNMSQGWSLYAGPLSDPSTLQAVASGYGYAGCTVANQGLGDLVGAGDLLVFSRWREDLPPAACGVAVSQQIYRLDAAGCPCPEIASSPGPLLPVDVDGGRIVAVGTNATLLLDRTGSQLLAVPVRALAAQLSGPDLVLVLQGELRDYDASSGSLVHAWPLPDVTTGGFCGSPHPWACPQTRLLLQDAAHGLAAYVVDGQVHVLRLADGKDVPLGAGTTARFMDDGLVYADGSRLRLVPYASLL